MNSFILNGNICYSISKTELKTLSGYVVCMDGKCAGVFEKFPLNFHHFSLLLCIILVFLLNRSIADVFRFSITQNQADNKREEKQHYTPTLTFAEGLCHADVQLNINHKFNNHANPNQKARNQIIRTWQEVNQKR